MRMNFGEFSTSALFYCAILVGVNDIICELFCEHVCRDSSGQLKPFTDPTCILRLTNI